MFQLFQNETMSRGVVSFCFYVCWIELKECAGVNFEEMGMGSTLFE